MYAGGNSFCVGTCDTDKAIDFHLDARDSYQDIPGEIFKSNTYSFSMVETL